MAAKKTIRGTREWAVAEVDCCIGCSHRCRYCYARHKNVVKKKLVAHDVWSVPQVRQADVIKTFPRYPGTVMFPVNHDIEPAILDDCIRLLHNLLAPGNRVLIVSKPHLYCIEKICRTFHKSVERILFRFSITAGDNHILRFWEPGAPLFEERLESLRHAYESGYQTSVSIEPMLDSSHVDKLVAELTPYVTHSIWIGKLNRIGERVVCDSEDVADEIKRIRDGQSDENIKAIYQQLKDHPLVRWKESIKEVIGLRLAEKPGEDI